MLEEKVNAQTDGRTHEGQWAKLAGLRPVDLKMIE